MKYIRITLSLLIAIGMVAVAPFASPMEAKAAASLNLIVSPPFLTAGVVPELVDANRPLTLTITDQNGKPVDLTRATDGSRIDTKVVWNSLFDDPHPDNQKFFGRDAALPQYYWTRTDLHNDDGTEICNWKMFGKNMIEIDFSRASSGVYVFKGFVANDEGEFYIRVVTPDRKLAGAAKIEVKSPIVSYSIKNMDDVEGKVFDSPGDPDFIMTAADNRIYNVRVTVSDANGNVIKGVTEGVNLCTGIKRTARFTPFTTRPANFEWAPKLEWTAGANFYAGGSAYFFTSQGTRYNLHIGLDLNNNGQLEWTNKELYSFGPQYVYDPIGRAWTGNLTYYNTSCVRYNDGKFSTHPFFDLPPTDYGGWGLGCIYNSDHFGGMIFADYNEDKKIDYRDSLNLDVNGQTSFYLFAEDVCNVGGLVGNSFWGDMDVAGRVPSNETSPQYLTSRWRGDGIYFLDFDAIPSNTAKIGPPQVKLLYAETREELPKYYYNPANYDMIYAVANHVVCVVSPADSRDLPIRENTQCGFVGNQHENSIYGNTQYDEQYNDVETTMHFTPTGTGEEVIEFRFRSRNLWFNGGLEYAPKDYELHKWMYLDVYKGLEVTIEWSEAPEVGKKVTAFVTCTAMGTLELIPGALINIKGCGFETTLTTNSKGKATTECTFTSDGSITVTAEKDGFRSVVVTFRVGSDKIPPQLEVEQPAQLTREEKIIVTGKTEPGCVVTINGQKTSADVNGKFTASITLAFGVNKIVVVATDSAGNSTERVVVVEMDNVPPVIMLDDIGKLVDVTEVLVSGRCEPGSRVRIGEVEATVVNDIFRAKVPVNQGVNNVVIIAMDKAGNSTEKPIALTVWHKTSLVLQIGNKLVLLDGKPIEPPLTVAPYIAQGRTMVPVRAISQGLGAKVEWLPEDKSVTVTMTDGIGTTFIIMRVGSKIAYVNQNPVTLDTPPEIKNGTTFIPLRFVTENMGCSVEYESQSKTITIQRISY